jgi:hypothetical protein
VLFTYAKTWLFPTYTAWQPSFRCSKERDEFPSLQFQQQFFIHPKTRLNLTSAQSNGSGSLYALVVRKVASFPQIRQVQFHRANTLMLHSRSVPYVHWQ